jgi:hypothetical protein
MTSPIKKELNMVQANETVIKASELRIGNIIRFDDDSDIVRVDWVLYSKELAMWFVQWTKLSGTGSFPNGDSLLEDFMPIPLSPEILEKVRFEVKDNGSFQVFKYGDFTFNTNHGWWYYEKRLPKQPKHVHQLQNLIFSLTGEELTINL